MRKNSNCSHYHRSSLAPPTINSGSIIDYFFTSFTTHQSQHSHLCYTYILHVLFSSWLTLCSMGYNCSNHCLVQFSVNLFGVHWSYSTLEASLYFNHLGLILCSRCCSISPSLLIIEQFEWYLLFMINDHPFCLLSSSQGLYIFAVLLFYLTSARHSTWVIVNNVDLFYPFLCLIDNFDMHSFKFAGP